MSEIQDLDPVDANNTGRWPENMQYSGVNNAGRADEGILARWFRDINGSLVASGESNAFAVSSNRTIASLANNTLLTFTANHAITGPATLNLNGLGDKPIRRFNGQPLAQGDIVSGQPVSVIFKTAQDYWFMTTAPAAIVANMFIDFSEDNPANPAADVARLYAKDIGGLTLLAYRDGAGVERILRAPDEAVGALLGILEHQGAPGSDESVASGWSTRGLNTEVYDRRNIISLASNTFTISEAGSYEIAWESPHFAGGRTRLYNVTGATVVSYATQGRWPGGTGNTMIYSTGHTLVTIAEPTQFAIQNDGGGGLTRGNYGVNEIFTRVIIRRG